MVPLQNVKFVLHSPPGALLDNAELSTATGYAAVDTKGFDYATIVLHLGATDKACTDCQLTDCDTSDGTYANVTGGVLGTDTNMDGSTSAVPTATDDDGFFVWHCDLRYMARYLRLECLVADGTVGGYYTAFAILSRAEQAPNTMAECGCEEVMLCS